MRIVGALACAGMLACSSSPPPPEPVEQPEPEPVVASPDAGPSIEDLRLAAFAKVMEETAGIRHECWARAAADDYKLDGKVILSVTLGQGGEPEKVAIENDATGDAVLTGCLIERYTAHRWPAVFEAGTTVKVPIQFDIPRGQYTVSAEDVQPVQAGAGLATLQLLVPRNTGNPNAAVFLLRMSDSRVETMDVQPDGAQVVYVAGGDGLAYDRRGKKRGSKLAPGTFLYMPPGSSTTLAHGGGDESLDLLVMAAPSPIEAKPGRKPPQFRVATADAVDPLAIAGGNGWVKMVFEPDNAGDDKIYAGLIGLSQGVKVPAHVHADSTELLFINKGSGTMTVAGRDYPVTAGMGVQVPPGVEHAFVAGEDVEALQFYTPAGPEQRFKAKK